MDIPARLSTNGESMKNDRYNLAREMRFAKSLYGDMSKSVLWALRELIQKHAESSDPITSRWVFRAEVFKSRACKDFMSYGDADPSNVSPQVRGAEMRVDETRAVNRALRKAYGIGICSVEEIGSFAEFLHRPERGRSSHLSRPMERTEATVAPMYVTASAS
jgi:hypothetical protein